MWWICLVLMWIVQYSNCTAQYNETQQNETKISESLLAPDRVERICTLLRGCYCPPEYGYSAQFFGSKNCKACNCGERVNQQKSCTLEVNMFGQVTDKTCFCKDGYAEYQGKCKGPCHPNPCHNNAKCSDTRNGYRCNCQFGYKGHTCDEKIRLCDSNPCLNNGTCEEKKDVNDLSYGFKCTCLEGFSGEVCRRVGEEELPEPTRPDSSSININWKIIGISISVVLVIAIAIYKLFCPQKLKQGAVIPTTPVQPTVVYEQPISVIHLPQQPNPGYFAENQPPQYYPQQQQYFSGHPMQK